MAGFIKVIAVCVIVFWTLVACNVYAWLTGQYGLALVFGLIIFATVGVTIGAYRDEKRKERDEKDKR